MCPFSGTSTVLYCATQLCVCSAGFELLEFEPLLFDGFDVPELLLLFEGLEEGFELLEFEPLLSFFDSEVFDLLEESAFAVSSFFSSFFSSCFTSVSSFFSSSVFAESSDGVKVAVVDCLIN